MEVTAQVQAVKSRSPPVFEWRFGITAPPPPGSTNSTSSTTAPPPVPPPPGSTSSTTAPPPVPPPSGSTTVPPPPGSTGSTTVPPPPGSTTAPPPPRSTGNTTATSLPRSTGSIGHGSGGSGHGGSIGETIRIVGGLASGWRTVARQTSCFWRIRKDIYAAGCSLLGWGVGLQTGGRLDILQLFIARLNWKCPRFASILLIAGTFSKKCTGQMMAPGMVAPGE
ncbi:hypothetical protein JOM56_012557 [Amanita muscaria]